jgi:hypothetical protein
MLDKIKSSCQIIGGIIWKGKDIIFHIFWGISWVLFCSFVLLLMYFPDDIFFY